MRWPITDAAFLLASALAEHSDAYRAANEIVSEEFLWILSSNPLSLSSKLHLYNTTGIASARSHIVCVHMHYRLVQ